MKLAPELYDIGFVEGEVPEEMQDLWADALEAKQVYEDLLDLIYEELEVE